MPITINARLQQNETLVGTWVSLTDPAVVEAISRTGFDFLLIDGEHARIVESELGNLLRAAVGGDSAIVYRVRENSEALIKMALDLGVDGVFVPQVSSADEARRAVQAAKYPPLGGRGVGPLRASDYYENYATYVERAEHSVTGIVGAHALELLPASNGFTLSASQGALPYGSNSINFSPTASRKKDKAMRNRNL